MKPKKIRLFVRSYCGWCHEAADWLKERGLEYEMIDVTTNTTARQEMVHISGQQMAPVIDVDGQILSDFDTGQLAAFWQKLEQTAA